MDRLLCLGVIILLALVLSGSFIALLVLDVFGFSTFGFGSPFFSVWTLSFGLWLLACIKVKPPTSAVKLASYRGCS